MAPIPRKPRRTAYLSQAWHDNTGERTQSITRALLVTIFILFFVGAMLYLAR